MKYLHGKKEREAILYMEKAAKIALKSSCLRAKCGSVVVKDNEIIGEGYNSPPGDKPLERCIKDELPEDFISDRTCCIHAEDRAIRDALKNNPDKIIGSILYFVRLDKQRDIVKINNIKTGKPYCTWCSKTALDVGIVEFVLWYEEGICVYDTKEYNKLSFQYKP